jgi:hypothetical protein
VDEARGIVIACICMVLTAFAIGIGAHIMRTSIKDECDRFGQTHIYGKQYVCTAVGKEEGR